MVKAFKRIPYLNIVRTVKCNLEILWKMERSFIWSDLLQEFNADTDNIFTATLTFKLEDRKKLFELLSCFPNNVKHYFRASHVYSIEPSGSSDIDSDNLLFDVKLMVHPMLLTNQRTARAEFNAYFDGIKLAVEKELGREP